MYCLYVHILVLFTYTGLLTSKIHVASHLKVGLYGKHLLMQLKKYC